MNVALGHNETTVRLGMLAHDAKIALERVERGEDDAMAGWLAYGAALNEGRDLFPSDEQFGQWVEQTVNTNLVVTPRPEERLAAMWAAREPINFQAMKEQNPRVRTVRGLHAKWAEAKAEHDAQEARRQADLARAEAQARANDEAARQRAEQAEAEAERAYSKTKAGKADVRDGLIEALNEPAPRHSQRSNPIRTYDPMREAVIDAAGAFSRVARLDNIVGLARWNGVQSMSQQARDEAERALFVIQTFIEEWDDENA